MTEKIKENQKELKPKRIYKQTGTVLTKKQMEFAKNIALNGGNGAKAIRDSGYTVKSAVGQSVMANDNLKNPNIVALKESIVEQAQQIIKNESINNIDTLLAIRDNPDAEDNQKRMIATDLLDRAGITALKPQQEPIKIEFSYKIPEPKGMIEAEIVEKPTESVLAGASVANV